MHQAQSYLTKAPPRRLPSATRAQDSQSYYLRVEALAGVAGLSRTHMARLLQSIGPDGAVRHSQRIYYELGPACDAIEQNRPGTLTPVMKANLLAQAQTLTQIIAGDENGR